MIASTLKKWRQNWPFLIFVTLSLFAVPCSSSFGGHVINPADLPLHLRVLGWPSVYILPRLIHGFPIWGSLLAAVPFSWSAFLWAVALLELKQVLAGARR